MMVAGVFHVDGSIPFILWRCSCRFWLWNARARAGHARVVAVMHMDMDVVFKRKYIATLRCARFVRSHFAL